MTRSRPDEILTTPVGDRPTHAGLTLHVITERLFTAHRLPHVGEALIGRSTEASIYIDDPSISRRHAIVRTDPEFSIEDLGSSNGTRVGGQPLVPGQARRVAVGETIEVGRVTLVLAQAGDDRVRRLVSHDHFETRLEDECARAVRGQTPLAVLRLSLGSDEPERRLQEALADTVGPEHLVGTYGPGEYELLFLGLGEEEAQALADRLTRRLRHGAELPLSGLACLPRDGRTSEALMAAANRQLRGVGAEPSSPASSSVVVLDPKMRALHEQAALAAAGNISVLLLGETGSGKEIFAETIHNRSPRQAKRFLRLNCAALTETLLESELFGHEKGAFSGAVQAKPGLLETAEGGTVFLDEVGEMPLSLQAKLLRVIEDRKVMRVGGLKARPIDVRFVSATNRDLEAESARGVFRLDLYYRLNGMTLTIPPLRERTAEIEPLARMFLQRAAGELGREPPALSPEALSQLERYPWPGNLRELRNMMERAALLCSTGVVTSAHLPQEKLSAHRTQPTVLPPASAAPRPSPSAPGAAEDDERARIIAALEQCAGNQTHAARLLGISRGTLVSRLAEYNLPRPRKR